MSTVDQFESVFKAAAKTTYVHEKHPLGKVMLVTDMENAEATLYLQTVRKFLEGILPETQTDWMLESKDGFENVKDLLDKVEEHQPDLVISYRNLRSDAWRWPTLIKSGREIPFALMMMSVFTPKRVAIEPK